jgi:hypothetical protein
MNEDSRKSETGESETRPKFALRPNIIAILAIGLLLLIAYQVYNGLAFQEIGFGQFSIKFAQPALKTPEALDASRDFFVGRWQVEHQIGGYSGYSDATIIDYFDDGSFSGSGQSFQGENGRRMSVLGQWGFSRLARDKFRLTVRFPNGQEWNGDFTIINHDRIHNINENYDAVRVPR